ncbi:MAG: DNA mismatch repair protein MutS, partial [Calditrichaeota bacterium]|nr:DNA mismatch repair protein MutS [Calditrichota bacterium]
TTLETGNFMSLDTATKRNLEILETINDSSGKATLVSILDSCKTSMGSRLIRNWISNPLIDQKSIQERLDLVDLFFNSSDLRSELRSIFAEIGDIERLLSRISTGKCSARDLLFLKNSLQQIGPLTDILDRFKNKQLSNLSDQFQGVDEISSLIEKAINPEAPHTLTEGNIIRTGYHGELDKLKDVSISGKDYIAKMQSEERSKTGITSLKIAYNKVFGYYIDITNTHKSKVPDHYIRKQTLVNSERYITPELKEYEEMVLGAEEKINTLEYQLFQDIREQIITELSAIQTNARLIAQIDVLSNYAELSESFTYCKPLIEDSNRLYFKNGRHPVVEHHLEPGAVFTKNDCSLDPENDQIMVITGPNMAGKSTYLRQCGLIVLMAQIGCFVPADDATIGICDRIFTRVGASDNLASGESTFLVEMNEAANILNNCSRKSLILFDELGRGTSTFDGLSIAWSVIEYLHNQSEKAAKTLFATHYHELTELEMLLSRVKNYNVAVEEYDDQVIFLRKIIPGGSDNSYGIQVAQMAGLPRPVIERAKEILFNLESNEINPTTQRPRLA